MILTEGTAKPNLISQLQIAGSSIVEFYGPIIQAGNALATSYYLTSNPSYTFYNKRYRTPLQDRDSSFNILEDDEDSLTFTAMDMGNSGGTGRRCMLCPQHCLCRADCSDCTDCGRVHRAGCYDRRSFVVSVSAVNDPPQLYGPSEIWAVEGMPYSLINTDYYEMFGGTLRFRQGASTTMDKNSPDALRRLFEKTCTDQGCKKVWLDNNAKDPKTGAIVYERLANGVGITDPDSKDYGYDTRKIMVKLHCSHGRLFVNERFLEEVLFNGDTNCDIQTNPAVSELGCRIRLVDVGHEQGKVGLYTRITAPFSEPTSCPALVTYKENEIPQPDGTSIMVEQRSFLSNRKVPAVTVSTTAKEWGCPCFSNVLFDYRGRSYDPYQPPQNNRFRHCSQAVYFNNKMPLEAGGGESVPKIGNRFIALEGSLRDISQVLANITYLPDPHFNTRVPGNSDEIIIEVDDGGALGDSLKDDKGQIIPPAPLTGRKVIKVNVESVNDAPKIGRRIIPTCEPKYADRKMSCPLGVNDPLTTNLQRLETWTQVPNWPDTNIVTETLATTINATLDYIDVDEDAIYAITPDILWVLDADSGEARQIYDEQCVTEPRMSSALKCEDDPACKVICRDPYGERLVNSFRCVGGQSDGSKCSVGAANTCGEGNECKQQAGQIFLSRSDPGELLLALSVSHGKLSFYPRPPQFPRTLAPAYTVLTNMTPGCTPLIPSCQNLLQPCAEAVGMVEFDCLFNVSHLWIRTTLDRLQFAIVNKYITYVSDLNYFGFDTLEIFVSDQGYTSDLYDTTKSVKRTITIDVVPINNIPTIMPPQESLKYQRGVTVVLVTWNLPAPKELYADFRTLLKCLLLAVNL